MAVITSNATGNFSAGATWVGGVAPGTGDDAVVATGHTVTIDTNTTVLSIQSSGGTFNINNGVTLTCTATDGVKGPSAGSVQTLRFTLGAGQSASIVGNVRGSTAVNVATIRLDNVGTLNITGDVTATTTLSLLGVLGTNAAGRYIVTGNITGGTSGSAYGAYITTNNARLDVTGNVTGGSATNALAVVNSANSATIVIVGNVTGGSTEAIYSDVIGSVIDITGAVSASTASAAVRFSVAHTTPPIIAGNIIDASNGRCAILATTLAIRTTANGNYTDHRSSAGGTARVIRGDSTYWVNSLSGLAASNVRSGTSYAGGTLTGTLAVPPANAVAAGTPVDNTVGTAALSPSDIAALVGAQITAALDSTP